MASQGMGTISHLEGELFQFQAGIRMTHVPYKGSAPAHVDLIGGRVQVMFDSVAAALPHIRSGRLRALGVTNATRVAALPEVPPIGEAGLPGFVADSWLGVFAPARTPAAVLERLRREIAALAGDAAFAKRVAEAGFEPRVLGPDDYAALMRRETQRWAVVVQRAGIRME
jgi:tripartite-type tricarboxylate transporter receptor subunit TctC